MPHPEDLQTPAVRLREPAEDFPWAILDDPLLLAREELCEALGRPLDAEDTARVYAWHMSRTRADQAAQWTVLERVLLWIGGPRAGSYRASGKAEGRPLESESETLERRIGLRAAIALAHFAPHSGLGFSVRSLGRVFGVSRSEVQRLRDNLRAMLPAANAES